MAVGVELPRSSGAPGLGRDIRNRALEPAEGPRPRRLRRPRCRTGRGIQSAALDVGELFQPPLQAAAMRWWYINITRKALDEMLKSL
ncbi:hypothetical protein Zm00014a_034383 [Zea mays]|uniref:Uncharacterized protein n=1 Tax=Zea mays TaxID=4577 RepID=A0A3L6EHQ0_MAIZE|nr:hypothetical protein Zm00014a_034383 [Zea mays]